ncbi:MFS transporter [Brachybacterium sp. FME24]|uniref:MFS transporter n=1 Tax=Brachybacterium sp. FME24 TaxID=2742605 RepID=UPI0027148128|nr:MFS transporter [Brachybacterium sp. FME24]
MPIPLRRRRWALYALFLLPGLSVSAWVTRTPVVRDLLEVSTAQMGMVLFGLSVGSMIGILSSGPLVMRLGTRPVVMAGSTLIVLAMPTIALGAVTGTPLLTAVGLALFGAGMGGGEVAMNVEGADVERLGGRPFLPALHGCFSLGTVLGAGLGILANAVDFSVLAHLGLTGVLGAGLLIWALRSVPSGTGLIPARVRTEQASTPRPAIWKDTRLVLIGGIVLAMALAEGTATDWLPLIMVDGHGFGATMGSTVFALFAAAMTVGRFTGGPIVARVGRARVLMVSALFAAAGLALIAFVDSQTVAVLAVGPGGLARLPARTLRRRRLGGEPRRPRGAGLDDRLPGLPGGPAHARLPRGGDRAALRIGGAIGRGAGRRAARPLDRAPRTCGRRRC